MRSLKNKEKRALTDRFPELSLDKKSMLQYDDKLGCYVLDGSLILIVDGDDLVPFLKSSLDFSRYPSAVIDMPAVSFMTRGADLLRPGVVRYDGFSKDDVIVVRDEKNGVALAFMRALVDSSELVSMEKGKIAKTIHYVGDRWWKEF